MSWSQSAAAGRALRLVMLLLLLKHRRVWAVAPLDFESQTTDSEIILHMSGVLARGGSRPFKTWSFGTEPPRRRHGGTSRRVGQG